MYKKYIEMIFITIFDDICTQYVVSQGCYGSTRTRQGCYGSTHTSQGCYGSTHTSGLTVGF